MGITVKRIRGIEYLYFTERGSEVGTTRFRNCGRASAKDAQLTALCLEYERLERRRAEMEKTMDGTRSRIRELESADPDLARLARKIRASLAGKETGRKTAA